MAKKPAAAFQLPADEEEIAPAVAPASTIEPAPAKAARELPEYRKGKKNLSVWIDERAFRQFKAMAAEAGITQQEYMIRLLNAEFAAKNRPTIAK